MDRWTDENGDIVSEVRPAEDLRCQAKWRKRDDGGSSSKTIYLSWTVGFIVAVFCWMSWGMWVDLFQATRGYLLSASSNGLIHRACFSASSFKPGDLVHFPIQWLFVKGLHVTHKFDKCLSGFGPFNKSQYFGLHWHSLYWQKLLIS